jgi:hypothetical protein
MDDEVKGTRTVYVAYTNTDCTEGRGFDVPIAICEIEITAMRLARKQYVQGSDGPVRKMNMVKIDGKWYAPGASIHVITPTYEDIAAQKVLDATRAAVAKAKAAGLSQDEIDLLTRGAPR